MNLENKNLHNIIKNNLKLIGACLLVIASIFLIGLPYLVSLYVVYIFTLIIIYGILAASYDILLGYTGQLSFAHGASFGLGAYVSALLTLEAGLSFWVTFPLVFFITMAVAAIIGAPTLRLKGSYFAVTTFFLAHLVYLIFLNTEKYTGGSLGLRGIQPPEGFLSFDFSNKITSYYFALIFGAILIILIYQLVNKSEIGKRFVAIREDEDLAESLGVNTSLYKTLSFSLSSAIAGLCGSFFAHWFLLLHPSQFSWFTSEMIVIMTIVGGLGTLFGPILGAAVITGLLELMRFAPELRFIFWAVILIAILIVEPKGIMGILKRIIPSNKLL
ncbi:MAG: branched-chain amino acid ABC transporter permease [Bacillota bacterium]|nr:branched-chain amino acid ABC transporter permease [Bacillota bacterium]